MHFKYAESVSVSAIFFTGRSFRITARMISNETLIIMKFFSFLRFENIMSAFFIILHERQILHQTALLSSGQVDENFA
jgi:hypothetical protein